MLGTTINSSQNFLNMKKKIYAIDLLPYAWLLFLLGVCISPRFKDLNNIFYLFFIPLTLIAIREHFSGFIRSPIYIWLLAFSGWMALSSLWANDPDFSDLKSILYVIFFISGIALCEETKALEKWGFLIPIAIVLQLFFSKIVGQRLSGFGPMENPLYAGHFYVFFSWLFLSYEKFHSRTAVSIAIRWTGFLLSAGACYLTQSRSAIVCLPLLILMFLLLRSNTFKYQKSITLTLALVVAATSTVLLYSNKWITLPNDSFNYKIKLEAGDVLLVKFSGINKPTVAPVIRSSSGQTTLLQHNSDQEGFLYTADKNDDLHVRVKLGKKTMNPWEFVKLYTKSSSTSFQLKEKFVPPRTFQFDLTFGYRTEIWSARIKHCLEKPIFGHGFSQNLSIPFQHYYVKDSHNFFLGTAFFGGIIALIIYVGLLSSCFYIFFTQKYWALLALLICGITTTLFDDENFFSSTRPYWLLLLFPIGKALEISLKQRRLLIIKTSKQG